MRTAGARAVGPLAVDPDVCGRFCRSGDRHRGVGLRAQRRKRRPGLFTDRSLAAAARPAARASHVAGLRRDGAHSRVGRGRIALFAAGGAADDPRRPVDRPAVRAGGVAGDRLRRRRPGAVFPGGRRRALQLRGRRGRIDGADDRVSEPRGGDRGRRHERAARTASRRSRWSSGSRPCCSSTSVALGVASLLPSGLASRYSSWQPLPIRSTPFARARCWGSKERRRSVPLRWPSFDSRAATGYAVVWLAASVVVWIVVPLAAATVRLRRADI